MRSTMIAILLSALVPACGGTVTAEGADPPADHAGGTGVRLEPWVAAGAGGGGSGTTTAASTSSTGTGSAGWGGQPTCVFGATGAVDAWVDNPSVEGWVWWQGSQAENVMCMGTVGSVVHSFGANLGPLHGPGQYTATGSYQRMEYTSSSEQMLVSAETFASPSTELSCVFDLTTAPESSQIDATVAGSFFCGNLVGTMDATQVVTIYDGSFSAQLLPPPE